MASLQRRKNLRPQRAPRLLPPICPLIGLEPGREVLVARDGDEAAGIVKTLDEERARAVGQAALRRVLAEHTYTRRAALFESVVDGVRMEAVQ